MENPMHVAKVIKETPEASTEDGQGGGAGGLRGSSPVVVGRLSTTDNISGLHSLYGEREEQTRTVVMRRLSQELGPSETLEETLSSKKRGSVEGRGSTSNKVDLSGQTDRDKALMRSAMASQKMTLGQNRMSALARGSTRGGRGAALRKPSQKYIPPSSPSLSSATESEAD